MPERLQQLRKFFKREHSIEQISIVEREICLNVDEVATRLKLTVDQVKARVKEGSLLSFEDVQGELVLPVAQLKEKRGHWAAVEGLKEPVQQLRNRGMDDFAISNWFVSPDNRLKGNTPLEHMQTKSARMPLRIARQVAA